MHWRLFLVVFATSGCASRDGPSVSQLPVCDHPCHTIDCGNSVQIPVTVIGRDSYLVGDTPTNTLGVSRVVLQATKDLSCPAPVSIRARPQTRFADIWDVLALAASNGSRTRLLVHLPGMDVPMHLDIAIPTQTQGLSNAVAIAYTARGVRVNDRDLSDKQLRHMLDRLAAYDHQIPILFLPSPETPYKNVINGLSECQAVGLRCTYVRLRGE